MIISVNGRLCDEREAVVSVYDHGFLYGIGLFETFRTYGGRPFLLGRHLKRLAEGCDALGIRHRPDAGDVAREIARLLKANGLADAYVRYSVSAGTDQLGLPAGDYEQPNVIVYVKPLPPADPELRLKGKPLQMLELRRNSPEWPVRFKSFHYMNNVLAKRELRGYPWATGAEGLFLDGTGSVAEGITSNVSMIRGRTCLTPPVDTGLLPGVTRAYVMELARREQLEVLEERFTWEQLAEADELFLTNSVQEIVPVCRVYDTSGRCFVIGDGNAGFYTRKLMDRYGS